MFTVVILPIYDVQHGYIAQSLIFTMVILPIHHAHHSCYPFFVGTTLTFSALVHSWLRRDIELFLIMGKLESSNFLEGMNFYLLLATEKGSEKETPAQQALSSVAATKP